MPLASVHFTRITQESLPIIVSFDGLTSVMIGGTLSATVESYLTCTVSVALFARLEESVAVKEMLLTFLKPIVMESEIYLHLVKSLSFSSVSLSKYTFTLTSQPWLPQLISLVKKQAPFLSELFM